MLKAEIRKLRLAEQKSLSRAEHARRSLIVAEKLFDEFDFGHCDFTSCFVALERNNEIDTRPIFAKFWRDFPRAIVCAPRVDFARTILENVAVSPDTKFVENKWRIREPQTGETIEPEKFDFVLTPLVAFDTRGFRVGYGKGFYDKFLKNCRKDCRKIGLSLFPPVEKIEDIADFDVKLDACATPEKVFYFD